MLTDLIFIANEMKQVAQRRIVEARSLREEFEKSGVMPVFPKELAREYEGFRLQYSIDKLSQGKALLHLSYCKLDKTSPTDDEKKEIEFAFFGKDEKVLRFPGAISVNICHAGVLINA